MPVETWIALGSAVFTGLAVIVAVLANRRSDHALRLGRESNEIARAALHLAESQTKVCIRLTAKLVHHITTNEKGSITSERWVLECGVVNDGVEVEIEVLGFRSADRERYIDWIWRLPDPYRLPSKGKLTRTKDAASVRTEQRPAFREVEHLFARTACGVEAELVDKDVVEWLKLVQVVPVNPS